MPYTPVNDSVYTAAFCGALSGITSTLAVPRAGISYTQYNNMIAVAGSYAEAVDDAWDNGLGITVSQLDLELIQGISEESWADRAPLANTALNPTLYAEMAETALKLFRSAHDYFTSEGVTPPPVPVLPSELNQTPKSIVWRPGTASVEGEHVQTWAEVEAWITASNILASPAPLLVYVDSSLAAAEIPATAATDCLYYVWLVAANPLEPYSGITTYVYILDGGQLLNLGGLDGVTLAAAPTAVTPLSWDAGINTVGFIGEGAGLYAEVGALVPLLKVDFELVIVATGTPVFLSDADPSVPIIEISAAQTLWFKRLGSDGTINGSLPVNTVKGAIGTTLQYAATADCPYTVQPLMLGTVTLTRFTEAASLNPSRGTTAQRPVAALRVTGQTYFDTDLGYAIWWDGTTWVIADGTQSGAAVAIAALEIDWELGSVFTKTLAAGANTFTFANVKSGRTISVRLTGAASTVTWPTVKWAGGLAPTQTASGRDVYTFIYDGTDVYGSVVQDMS